MSWREEAPDPLKAARTGKLLVVRFSISLTDPYHYGIRPVTPDRRYPHWRLRTQGWRGYSAVVVAYAPSVQYVRQKWPHTIDILNVAQAPDHTLAEGLGDFAYPEWFRCKVARRIQDTDYWRLNRLLTY
jgi:hypothetical protein